MDSWEPFGPPSIVPSRLLIDMIGSWADQMGRRRDISSITMATMMRMLEMLPELHASQQGAVPRMTTTTTRPIKRDSFLMSDLHSIALLLSKSELQGRMKNGPRSRSSRDTEITSIGNQIMYYSTGLITPLPLRLCATIHHFARMGQLSCNTFVMKFSHAYQSTWPRPPAAGPPASI